MGIGAYLGNHWLVWLGAGLAAVIAWLATNVVAQPILGFWSDRRAALNAVQEHGLVDWNATGDRVSGARTALREASACLLVYAQGGPAIVTAYARLRGYDLAMAARALGGVHDMVGESSVGERQRNACDTVRLCIGATAMLSRERIAELRRLISEEHAS